MQSCLFKGGFKASLKLFAQQIRWYRQGSVSLRVVTLYPVWACSQKIWVRHTMGSCLFCKAQQSLQRLSVSAAKAAVPTAGAANV